MRHILLISFALASLSFAESPTATESAERTQGDIPVGIFIRCSLLFTVESSTITTPVVGKVTAAVYHEKQLIIPAGTVVMCLVQPVNVVRDRIEVSGEWSLALPNGKASIDGLVCDCEADPEYLKFGVEDGSAGLLGTVVSAETSKDHFVRVAAGKEFYIVTTNATK